MVQQRTFHLGLILLGLLIAAVVSMFSGFVAFPVPFELAWQFSPIGLLQGIRPEHRDIESVSYFAGTFGPTFDYTIYFLKTCLLELPFYWLCLRRLPLSAALAVLVLANLATHPIVFFVIPRFFEHYLSAALVSEAFAPALEMGIVYFVLRVCQAPRWGVALVLMANLFSWEVGSFL